MRNLSFALTMSQMRARTKTVTRRCGDFYARVFKPGDLVCAVEKSQGIAKGGLVRLGVIRIVSVRLERLGVLREVDRMSAWEEIAAEGFPGMSGNDFVAMFREHMGGNEDQLVTRIEFEHTDLPVPGAEVLDARG